jgi:phosphoglycolate phosphatase
LAVARLGLADGERIVEVGYPLFLDAYGQAIDTHTTLYPGVVAAIGGCAPGGRRRDLHQQARGLAIDLIDRLALRSCSMR